MTIGSQLEHVSKVPQNITTPNYAMVLDRLVRDPAVPMDRVEKAMELIERQQQNEAKVAYSIAMAQAQQEMTTVSRDMTNPQTKSRYASLGAVDRAIRPIYSRHGLAPSFDTKPSTKGDNWIKIICELAHTSGYSREFSIDMPADGIGAKGGAVMTKTHATMAAATYGRRGLLKLIFNLAEDDDDGNAADDAADQFFISDEQKAELTALIERSGRTVEKSCAAFRVDSLDVMPVSKFEYAKKLLQDIIKDEKR